MITEVNKETFRTVIGAIEKALESVSAEYGVIVEIQGGKFSPDEGYFAPKLIVKTAGSERKAWESLVGLLRSNWDGEWLTAEDYGKEITVNGTVYTLASINLNKPKFAIGVVRKSDNAPFGLTEAGVRKALGR